MDRTFVQTLKRLQHSGIKLSACVKKTSDGLVKESECLITKTILTQFGTKLCLTTNVSLNYFYY